MIHHLHVLLLLFFNFYLHLFYAEFIHGSYVFIPLVFPLRCVCVHANVHTTSSLVQEQSVLFSKDHLSAAERAHSGVIRTMSSINLGFLGGFAHPDMLKDQRIDIKNLKS